MRFTGSVRGSTSEEVNLSSTTLNLKIGLKFAYKSMYNYYLLFGRDLQPQL